MWGKPTARLLESASDALLDNVEAAYLRFEKRRGHESLGAALRQRDCRRRCDPSRTER